MDKACRMCAGVADPGINLLDASQHRLASWTAKNLGLEVHKGNLSTTVCVECIKQIQEWMVFKDKTVKAHKRFTGVRPGESSTQVSPAQPSVSPKPGPSLVDNFILGVNWIPDLVPVSQVKSKTIDILRQVRIRPAPLIKDPPANVQHTPSKSTAVEEENVDEPEAIEIEDSEVEDDESIIEEMSPAAKYNLKELSIVLNKLSDGDIEKYSRGKQQNRRVRFSSVEDIESEVETVYDRNKSKSESERTRAISDIEPTRRSSRYSLLNEEATVTTYKPEPVLTVPEFVPVEVKEESKSKSLDEIAADIEAKLQEDEELSKPRVNMQDLCSALSEGLAQKVQQSRSLRNISRSRVSGLRRKKSTEESQRTMPELSEPQIQNQATESTRQKSASTSVTEQNEPSVYELPSPSVPISAQNLAAVLKCLPKKQEYSIIPAEFEGETVFYIKLKSNNSELFKSSEAQNGTNIPSISSSSHDIQPLPAVGSSLNIPVVEVETQDSSPLEQQYTENFKETETVPAEVSHNLNEAQVSSTIKAQNAVILVPPNLPVEAQNTQELSETSPQLPSEDASCETSNEVQPVSAVELNTMEVSDLQEHPETIPEVPTNVTKTLLHGSSSTEVSQETDNALEAQDLQELSDATPEVPSSLRGTLINDASCGEVSQETDNEFEAPHLEKLPETASEVPSSFCEASFHETSVNTPEETGDAQEFVDIEQLMEKTIEEADTDVLAALPQIAESGDLSTLTPEAMKCLGLTLEGSIPPRGTKYIPPNPNISPPTLVCKAIQNTPTVSPKQPVLSKNLTPTACKSITSSNSLTINKSIETVNVSKNKSDEGLIVNVVRRSSGRVAAKKAREKFSQAGSSETEDNPDDPDVVLNSDDSESGSALESHRYNFRNSNADTFSETRLTNATIVEDTRCVSDKTKPLIQNEEQDCMIVSESPAKLRENVRNVSVTSLYQAQATGLSSGVLDSNKIAVDTTTTDTQITNSVEILSSEIPSVGMEDTNATKRPSLTVKNSSTCPVCQQQVSSQDLNSHPCLQTSRNKKRYSMFNDFDDDAPVAKTCCVVCHKLVPNSHLSKHPCFLGQPSIDDTEKTSQLVTEHEDVNTKDSEATKGGSKNSEVSTEPIVKNLSNESSPLSTEISVNLPSNCNINDSSKSPISAKSHINANMIGLHNTEKSKLSPVIDTLDIEITGLGPSSLSDIASIKEPNAKNVDDTSSLVKESNLQSIEEENISTTEKEESFTKLPEDLATFVLENETSPKTAPTLNLNESPTTVLKNQDSIMLVDTSLNPGRNNIVESVNIDASNQLTDEALLNFSVPENSPEVPDVPQIDTTLFDDTITSIDIPMFSSSDENDTQDKPNLTCSECNAQFEDTKSFVNHYAIHSYAAKAIRYRKKKTKKLVKKVRTSKTRKSPPDQPENLLDETFIQNLIDVNLPKADDLTIQQVAMNTSVDKLYNDLQQSEKEKSGPRKSLRVKNANKLAKKVVKTVRRRSMSSIKYECAFCDKSYVQKSRIELHISSHLSNIVDIPENTNIETIIESIKTPKNNEKSSYKKSIRVKKLSEKMQELEKNKKKKKKKNYFVSKREGGYECDFCQKTYSQRCRMENHILDHLNEELEDSYTCEICNQEFSTFYLFSNHQIVHIKPYSCGICSKRFKSIKGKTVHETEQHKNQCTECKLQFKSEKCLEKHFSTTHETIKCLHCQKLLKTQNELNLHIKKTHKNITYNCHLCNYVSHQKSELNSHVKKNHKNITYSCHMCNYVAFHKSLLCSHIEGHDIKDFKLKMKQRLLKSDYPCVYCDRDFHTEQIRREHSNDVHSNEFPFSCEYCSYRCRTENASKKHKNIHEDYPCPKCSQRFKMLSKLTEHIKSHGINNITVTKDNLNVLFSMPGTSKSNNYTPIRNFNDEVSETKHKCGICMNLYSSDDLLDHTCFDENQEKKHSVILKENTEKVSSPEPPLEATLSTPKTRSAKKSENSNKKRHSSVLEAEEPELLAEVSPNRKRCSSVLKAQRPGLLEEGSPNRKVCSSVLKTEEPQLLAEGRANRKRCSSVLEAQGLELLAEGGPNRKRHSSDLEAQGSELLETKKKVHCEIVKDVSKIKEEQGKEETIQKRTTNDSKAKLKKLPPSKTTKLQKQQQQSKVTKKKQNTKTMSVDQSETNYNIGREMTDKEKTADQKTSENVRSLRKRKAETKEIKPNADKKIKKVLKKKSHAQVNSVLLSEEVTTLEKLKVDEKTINYWSSTIQNKLSSKLMCSNNGEINEASTESQVNQAVKKSDNTSMSVNSPEKLESKSERVLRNKRERKSGEKSSPDKKSGAGDIVSVRKKLHFTNEENQTAKTESMKPHLSKSPKKSELKQTTIVPQNTENVIEQNVTNKLKGAVFVPLRSQSKKVVNEESEAPSLSPISENVKKDNKSFNTIKTTSPEKLESQSPIPGRVLRGQKLQESPEKPDTSEVTSKKVQRKKQAVKLKIEILESEILSISTRSKKTESPKKPQTLEVKPVEVISKKQAVKPEVEKLESEVLRTSTRSKKTESPKKTDTLEVQPVEVISKKQAVKPEVEKSESEILPVSTRSKNTESPKKSETAVIKSEKVVSKKEIAKPELVKSKSDILPSLGRNRLAENTESPKKSKAEKCKVADDKTVSLAMTKQSPKTTKSSTKKKVSKVWSDCNKELSTGHVCVKKCEKCQKSYPTSDIETHRCTRAQSAQKTCLKCKQSIYSLSGSHVCNRK